MYFYFNDYLKRLNIIDYIHNISLLGFNIIKNNINFKNDLIYLFEKYNNEDKLNIKLIKY